MLMRRLSVCTLAACLLATLSVLPAIAASVAFNARQDIATGFQQLTGIAVGDFNGDGKPDIAAIDLFDKRVVVYLNNGSGGFGTSISTTLDIPDTTGALVAGDVNEDGKQDLIVGTVSGIQANYILLGKGDGTFTQSGTMPNTSVTAKAASQHSLPPRTRPLSSSHLLLVISTATTRSTLSRAAMLAPSLLENSAFIPV